ncbi:MAG: hypothetical protein AAF411_10305 [Myxococcota bacterium]
MTRREPTPFAIALVFCAGCGLVWFEPGNAPDAGLDERVVALDADASSGEGPDVSDMNGADMAFEAQLADTREDTTDADPGPADCPPGYVPAPPNEPLRVDGFCLMIFEAKAARDENFDGVFAPNEVVATGCGPACEPLDAGSFAPISVAAGQPWRQVSQEEAKAACLSLGAGFDLISNAEWMAVARDIERTAANWSGGEIGEGRVAEGNTGEETARPSPLDVVDPSDAFDGAGDGSVPERRRVLQLSNGAAVWDFAGNVQEWVDWTLGGALGSSPSCPSVRLELPDVSCAALNDDDYNSADGTLTSEQGVGTFFGGSGGGARRGGQRFDASSGNAGIYAINLNRASSFRFASTGFRCVFREPR